MGTERLTANTAATLPEFPSVTEALPIDTAEVSSSTIVPIPWLSAMVALTAFVRLSESVSSISSIESPATVTVTVLLVSPGRNVRGPLTAV